MATKKYSSEELNRLLREAEEHFKKLPGVVGVGYGFKQTDGKITDELSFRVYVEQKKSLSDIPDNEKIPDTFQGISTDVILSFTDELLACDDTQHHDPIVGGITITVDDILFNTVGTLGCLTTLKNEKSKDNIGLLSNQHVLDRGLNVSVYHPFFNASGTSILDNKTKNEGVIAKICNTGTRSNVNFHYPGDSDPTAHPYFLDCALAKVTTSHSSCCSTNCGTKYNAVIADIGPIRGVKRLQASDIDPNTPFIVRKRGRRTGLTQGKVVDANASYDPGNPKHGVILVAPIENNCEGVKKFADSGDSGSVVVNDHDEVIGLLFAMPSVANTSPFFGYGIVCHIHPVLNQLNTDIIVTPQPSSEDRLIPETKYKRLKSIDELKQEFISKNDLCRDMYNVFERYRGEVAHLVNHKRPVTVVWHRHFGTQFIAHFIKNFNNPAHEIPDQVKDVSLAKLLIAMRKILSKEGSDELKSALDQYGDQVIALCKDCKDIENLLQRLSKIEEPIQ